MRANCVQMKKASKKYILKAPYLLVVPHGLEPWTPWLWVS